MNKPLSISFVIPAHNEQENIQQAIQETTKVAKANKFDYEIIIVDDFSQDNTVQIVESLHEKDKHLVLIKLPNNIGANPAILQGLLQASKKWSFYIPADMQVMPGQVLKLLEATNQYDYISCYRSNRQDGRHRIWMGKAYNWLVRKLFHIDIHDVDSSTLIKTSALKEILPSLISRSDFLPVDIIVNLQKSGYHVTEIEIDHQPRIAGKPSSIKPLGVIKTFYDLFKHAYYIKHT